MSSEKREEIAIYDTTLRDGSQGRGVNFTVEDKLKLTRVLDDLGVRYIEGGWPGSNPKDVEYFNRVRELSLSSSKVTAFGSTRRKGITPSDDANLKALVDSNTPVVTIFGKTWKLHASEVLRVELSENLEMIRESVDFLKQKVGEVIYDAEHFFDGFYDDSEYALSTLRAAVEGGADCIVLCDTNGGRLPEEIAKAVRAVKEEISTPLGIHAHNDSEVAVANSIAAVRAGCVHVQGTLNGFGERCGNANLVSVIPGLQLKLGFSCIPDESLKKLSEVSRQTYEIANINPNLQAAYVGQCAFTHKGGVHVSAVERVSHSYEHIEPELVGNKRHVVLSELSGRGNVRVLASEMGLDLGGSEAQIVSHVKELENLGYEFENADGSIELFMLRAQPDYKKPFEIVDLLVVSERRRGESVGVEATVKLKLESGEIVHTAADGDGPVHALDRAFKKALLPTYPGLDSTRLTDYKVRILNPDQATGAVTRVLIEAANGERRWCTVGCSSNIIEASVEALSDSYELSLRK